MLASLFALPLAPAPDPYEYDYSSTYDNSMDAGSAVALFLAIMGIYALMFVVAFVANGLAWAGAFDKAGHAKWKAFVPFYSTWIIVKMVGRPESHFWYTFIPYYNIYIMIVIMNDTSKSFGKDTGFTVGLVFVPVVFAAILSYGNAAYRGPSYLTPQQKQHAQQYGQPYGQQYGQPHGQQYAPAQQYPGQQPYAQQPYAQQDPNAQNAQYGQGQQQFGQPQDPSQNPYGSGPTQ